MKRRTLVWIGASIVAMGCGRGPETQGEAPLAPPTTQAPAAAPLVTAAAAPPVAEPAVKVAIDGLPSLGNPAAPVTMVMFTDYECPYCAKADRTMYTLRAELGDDVRVVLAMRPLPMHTHANEAARALLAAAEQGKAEAMHERLFANQAGLDDVGLAAAAKGAGLDVAAFETARRGPRVAAALERHVALATSLGVAGTPTFFVNGRRVMGARPYEELRAVVEEERGHARELVAHGTRADRVYARILETAPAHVDSGDEDVPGDAVVDVPLGPAPVRGDARAPVTIALFSDYECPFCVKTEATLKKLEAAYPGQVKVAFKNRPLPMHEHARLAAKASLAAGEQGRFWEFHDVLVAHRDQLERAALEGYARQLGLDGRRFARDLDSPELDARLDADVAQATKLDVRGTPTAFVNGRRITGAQPEAVFRAAIDQALARR